MKKQKVKQMEQKGISSVRLHAFARQMHKFGTPTAFMQFNYVYILRSVFIRVCFAFCHMQTEQFLPLIPVGSSVFSVRRNTTFFLFVPVCVFFLSLFLSLSTWKSSRFTQTPAGAVICLSNAFCCEGKKNINTEQSSAARSRAEGREDYYCCLP